MFDKALFDQITFDGQIVVTYYQTLTVTEISIPSLTKVGTFLKTLSVTMVSVVNLIAERVIVIYSVLLSATIVSVATIKKRFFKILSVTEKSVISLLKWVLPKKAYLKKLVSYLSQKFPYFKKQVYLQL